ncbi:MAG: c-type cytochrome biogenesis protein CcmI, partial [Hyphomicrobiales bacterium]
MFWTSIGFLSLVVIATVLYPLLRRGRRLVSQVPHSIRVYRDQLDELGNDLASGLLSEEQAGAARIEVERRILAATSTGETASSAFGAMGQRLTVALIALALPVGGL